MREVHPAPFRQICRQLLPPVSTYIETQYKKNVQYADKVLNGVSGAQQPWFPDNALQAEHAE